jgi:hypothetical protein
MAISLSTDLGVASVAENTETVTIRLDTSIVQLMLKEAKPAECS